MIQIKFSIHGNHEDKHGNPIPKARFTRAQHFAGFADRYREYLEYVRGIFHDAVYTSDGRLKRKDLEEYLTPLDGKPLSTGKIKCRMEIFITWANETHGDPENIFGAIADALFKNDKYLAVVADFDGRVGRGGRVDALITIGAE